MSRLNSWSIAANRAYTYTHKECSKPKHCCDVAQALKQGQLGPSTILGVVAPLLQQALAGARGLEGGPHKRKGAADGEKARGQDAALAESAIATLQAAAAALGWHPYRQLLGRCAGLVRGSLDSVCKPSQMQVRSAASLLSDMQRLSRFLACWCMSGQS